MPTPDHLENMRRYWFALGHFIDMFAIVECTLQLVWRHHARLSHATACALLPGVRVDQSIACIKRLYQVNSPGTDARDDFEYVSQQIGIINRTRNDILHYGTQFTDDERLEVTTALTALTEDRARTFPISPEILEDLIYDLQKIQMHLVFRHLPTSEHPGYVRSVREPVLTASWRYKQPAQSPSRQKNQ